MTISDSATRPKFMYRSVKTISSVSGTIVPKRPRTRSMSSNSPLHTIE